MRNIARLLAVLFLLTMFHSPVDGQTRRRRRPRKAAPVAPSALKVVPDLAARVARFKPVDMPYQPAGLSARERQLVEKLVEASRCIEDIYWRQTDPEGLTLYEQLAGKTGIGDRNIRTYLFINAGRYDLLSDNQPFVGTEPFYAGRGYYPRGLTQDEIEQHVKEHPEKKDAIYDPYTVVRWVNRQLDGVPYHVAYQSFLEPAAKALREAADLSDDQAFAAFLRARADALLKDDYYPSDLLWVDLDNPKFDVIFAPYETYDDGLLGVKTSYGAAVLIRNQAESEKLEVYKKYIPDIQDALPLPPEDRPSKKGHQSPMEVMDAPFRAGDLNHGYQAVADNLPNDPRIHQEKGTKKIFFKNFMDARVQYVVLPLAKKLMRADQSAQSTAEGYMADTLLHEIAHGLGPAFARMNGKQVDIREAIGPTYSALEEAKADIVGLFGLKWLADQDAIPKERLGAAYAAHLADIFRTVRFGVAEAHGKAEIMEFNYLLEQNAIQRGPDGRYALDYERLPQAIAALARELLEIEATGDRSRAEDWFTKYGNVPPELAAALKGASDVPVDILPKFSFAERVE